MKFDKVISLKFIDISLKSLSDVAPALSVALREIFRKVFSILKSFIFSIKDEVKK